MTWSQIRCSDGINMKKIPITSLRHVLPSSVSEEEEIFEMRVSQRHRIWGFQNQSTFYVLWFALNMQSVLHNEKSDSYI